jgi:LmbE family N-acetylglucosaminyl deacetylase
MHRKCDVLVVIAHPDDEIFVSGTICLCVERGFEVAILAVTNGEGGDDDLVNGHSAFGLGEVRRRELELSAANLGVNQVMFLDLPDMAPDRWCDDAWNAERMVTELGTILQKTAPSVILVHGPEGGGYGHPAHKRTFQGVMAGARSAGFDGSIFSFCARPPHSYLSWYFDRSADIVVDVRGYFHRRSASLGYHQSQSNFFLKPKFPRTPRKWLSALYGVAFCWTESGRKRIPVGSQARFIRLFPAEGLALQKNQAGGQPHFFLRHFSDEARVSIGR